VGEPEGWKVRGQTSGRAKGEGCPVAGQEHSSMGRSDVSAGRAQEAKSKCRLEDARMDLR